MKKPVSSPFTLYFLANSEVVIGDAIDGDIANCPAVTRDPDDGDYYLSLDGKDRLWVTHIAEVRRRNRARRLPGRRYRRHDVFRTDVILDDDFERLVEFAVLLNGSSAANAPTLANLESMSEIARSVYERLTSGAGGDATVMRWCETVIREAHARTVGITATTSAEGDTALSVSRDSLAAENSQSDLGHEAMPMALSRIR